MKNLGKPISTFGLLCLLLVILNARSAASQEVEDEREFDYLEGSGKGPDHWGELHEEWAACKNGDMQSPIDLLNKRVQVIPALGRMKRSYKPSIATLKNRGHDIALQWVGGGGSININGTDYVLQQSHWHSPSEHTINGRRFDLELHMVHVTSDTKAVNKIAVIGILYKIGRPDDFLSELMKGIWSIADSKGEVNVGVVDPRHIKIGSRKYYRYMGSLTVPPCTQGVIWTINKKVRTVTRGQVKALRVAVHDYAEENSRPLQLLNNRNIQLYRPQSLTRDLVN
ncbi:PREDICTED: alpha carbonic anhydrase 7-like [Nelumbo nucifera]|uniref:Carbonic anhydrase n=2 Tax=Nelumbo nucifera TaxID=4432 RepID=A0A1U8AVK0_NELNU|nr:PREDICTED: alpha carbonic anhydrase 7-like [Nelumbo nucifera]DAD48802.1 TPA_asm: hypothetical protein HUJ06_018739 [Nelumbo nucifera]